MRARNQSNWVNSDPVGVDVGQEEVTVGNFTTSPVNLTGWKFRDAAEKEFALSGTLAPGARRTFRLPSEPTKLTNSGDVVLLIDHTGSVRHRVSYTDEQAKPSRIIEIP